jgi:hypothetical protein
MNTETPAARPGPSGRDFSIDWLRITALGLLILYHVGMYYVSWGWHVKSVHAANAGALLEPWMRLASPWRMSLLFLVSGMALSLMLARRGAQRGWLGERARRLLLPLAAGVALIVPPQAYFEVRQFHGYAGSFFEFLGRYYSADGSFCSVGRGCLILPTWNHLWFLPYLFAYTAGAAWLLRRRPAALDAAAARASSWLAGWRLLAGPFAWLAATRLALRPLFGETHAFVDDLFAHTQHAAFFAAGLVLARSPALLDRIQAARYTALAAALLGWGLLVATPAGPGWRALPFTLAQLGGVAAALGFARAHLKRDSAARRYLTDAVFPVYVLHQTLTIVAAVALAPLGLPPLAEAIWLVTITLAGSFAGYELVRRVGALRPWFGLARGPRRNAAAPVSVPRISA